MTAGAFVSLEGIDGSGKSTQARMLAEALGRDGQEVVLTREPGGSPGAEEIRRLLVEGAPDRWSPETEILLFTAARRDHLERTIRPALDRDAVVVSDRFLDSTRVYQGRSRADLRALVEELHRQVIGREPNLTLIIDTDPEVAAARRLARDAASARFETMGAEFQIRAREGFLALARRFPLRCRAIDGNRDPEVVAADVLALTQRMLTDLRARRRQGL